MDGRASRDKQRERICNTTRQHVQTTSPDALMAPSAAEEAAFMASILLGLDNSLSTTAGECAPPRTPTKPVKQPERDGDLDTISFLEGSENWDLDDLSFSPIKPSSTIVKKAVRVIFTIDDSRTQKRLYSHPFHLKHRISRILLRAAL